MLLCRPVLRLNPVLAIGIRFDQRGIDPKGLALDQALADAALQNALKKDAEQIAFAKTTVPIFRECRMVRDRIVQIQPANPPVRQVQMNFLAEPSLRPDP